MVSFKPSDETSGIAPVTDISRRRRDAGRSDPASGAEQEPGGPSHDELEAAVVRAIGRRGLTEKEVSDLVRTKGGDSEQAESVLERMRELRYVDDARVAEEMVHRLSEARGKSRSVVSREMSARGIGREVVDEALDGISDDHERTQAIDIALKRGAQLRSLDDATFERRLSGYLARRGYAGSIVREAIASARAERRSTVRFQ